ncbi:MAG: acetyl-CoA carboxylase, biotin carboxyl carrier protein [Planctomycetes bacterium RBG_16_64_10]|nr:MAG: acetyl-CoA carboxylase, biotin carboxyl carrier protein [Planctomycetes bacterium RBG_16_64_10]
MSNSGAGHGDVFDVRKIRRLVELMNEYDLAEIDLRQADQRIRLRRGAESQAAAIGLASVPAVNPVAVETSPSSAVDPRLTPVEKTDLTFIRSPMVGTFYTSPSPDAEPFVQVGDLVSPDTTVCVVEAMKVFNEIPAECSGQIVAVVAENGEPVEFGQPLFKVDPGK